MDGKTHFIVGGIAGVGVANYIGADLSTAVSLTLLGGCVGLVPDLDVNGTLAKRVTMNKNWLVFLLGLLGIMVIIYSVWGSSTNFPWLGIIVGSGLLTLPSIIVKQKMMLLLTGLAIGAAGISLQSTWLIMLGVYISIASRLPHRSLTHSLIGLGYFSGFGYFLEQDIKIDGVMFVCSIGYLSHLILDMKWIPKNRRGVKFFQPFSKLEL
ncbi:metal-dependent hydrolase [Lederbergia citrea]|uniref:Metal-dependent hydrolase n=1 Tax=Lederbergia citrea TaxID=2833581 RepID=A0A942ULK7_9BACI|nr:metal-dependent hydrolase [Lederbergia citrea]MBS4176775.1 metal-dependent hydrolase [Lederbergia citrea]MBS4221992.1 metal-dependent hydrolase [Lederbergia citrea]